MNPASGPIPIDASNAAEVARKVKAGELPGPAKSLAEAICRVMARVAYVQKDKQMQGGGSYRYVSVEAVIDALRPEMIKEGLVLLPAGVETMHQGDHGRQVHLRVKYEFKLTHAPSGQSEPVVVIGEGMDVGDKSSNKAMTAARKYALIMAFNIETGTDPDDTPSSEQERAKSQPAPAPQRQQPATPATGKDDLILRAKTAAAIVGVANRDALSALWRAFEADLEAGRLGPGDRSHLLPLFQEAAKRFPAPARK